METMSNTLVNLKEIAQVLKVSNDTIYYWVGRNEIPFIRVGRHLRFVVDDVLKFFLTKMQDRKPNCHRRENQVNIEQSCSLKIGAPARTRNFTSLNEE